MNSGLLVEVWTKGMIWDRALGYKLITLDTIPFSKIETHGQWYQLDSELIVVEGDIVGTKSPTGQMIMLDCRFEPPFGRYFFRLLFFNSLIFRFILSQSLSVSLTHSHSLFLFFIGLSVFYLDFSIHVYISLDSVFVFSIISLFQFGTQFSWSFFRCKFNYYLFGVSTLEFFSCNSDHLIRRK